MDRQAPEFGTLYVVATPIGNRDDLAPRARQVLEDVAVIAAEDTRHTGRFLSHFGIRTPLLPFHEHNEALKGQLLLERLAGGEAVALVSDAGTPLVSDPGYRLVSAALDAGIPVSPVPGASAVTAALSVSGLPTDRFVFEGFLPPRRAARRQRLERLRDEPRTLLFLESVHKIERSLEDLADLFGSSRPAFIGRELTKLHEQCVRATLGELSAALADGRVPVRGEFVLVVGGAPGEPAGASSLDVDTLLAELTAALPGREAVRIAARVTGGSRNALYERMLALRDGNEPK